jgi:mannose-6-phosphate isomerase-like protein (cupin superfamily)
MTGAFDLSRHPVHLGLGARAAVEPAFDGTMDWYAGYGARHASDGVEGRLVSMHTFEQAWDIWEMHPEGEELVVCVSGRLTLVQEVEGATREIVLEPGWAAVNGAGVWHTADVDRPTTALFITAGAGTQHRPR